jgi:hypothetical protein
VSRSANFFSSTPKGIDIKDAQGFSCLGKEGSSAALNEVTFPLARLNTISNRKVTTKLIRLWEYETGLVWEGEVSRSMSRADITDLGLGKPYPTDFYEGLPGLPLIRGGQKDLSAYCKSPKPADETWLLARFLDYSYPEGGMVFLSKPDRLPEHMRKDSFWTRLQQ